MVRAEVCPMHRILSLLVLLLVISLPSTTRAGSEVNPVARPAGSALLVATPAAAAPLLLSDGVGWHRPLLGQGATTVSDDDAGEARRRQRYESAFQVANTLSYVGMATLVIGAVAVGVGLVLLIAGIFTAIAGDDGALLLAGAFTALGGFGLGVIGGLVLTAGVISTSFTLKKLEVPVKFTGLAIAGASAAVVVAALMLAAGLGDSSGALSRVASYGLVGVVGGLVTQAVMSQVAYRRYRDAQDRGAARLRLAPFVGPRRGGLALAGRF